jgi:hypothetical protein
MVFLALGTKHLTTMALLNCIECGNKVSDLAEKCPKCGTPISIIIAANTTTVSDPVVIEKEPLNKNEQEISQNKTVLDNLNTILASSPEKEEEPDKQIQENPTNSKSKAPLFIGLSIIGVILLVVFFKLNSSNSITNSDVNQTTNDRTEQLDHTASQPSNYSNNQSSGSKQNSNSQRSTPSVDPEIEKKRMYRENIKSYVNVQYESKAKVIAGVKDVFVRVNNNTEYNLEKVIVNVYYYKMNDKLYTVKKIIFDNVPAEGGLTMAGEDTEIGFYIKAQIEKIDAPELY